MPWTKVYTEKADFENTLAKEGLRGLSYREAIKEAQIQLLETDKRVFLIGEGIDDSGGTFGTTLGLQERFGKDRVMDIPIAENGLTAVAIGAAIAGLRPIFIHMRMDFLPMCMDQIINHAAKWSYMTGGHANAGLVIRSIIGRGWGSAAQHSQALHSLFTHVPGLKVVMPATPYDAKGLLISSVRDGNPVLFVEHRWIYDYIGYVPEELYEVPIGKGIIRRQGKDVTIVAASQMVYFAIKAANELQTQGIDAEIIDIRCLKPLDDGLIIESVTKTGCLVVADLGHITCGFASEIIARLVEKASFKGPVERVSAPDTPIPASSALEKAYYPGTEHIVSAVNRVVSKKNISKPAKNLLIDKYDISVIMPALNEEDNITKAVNNTLLAFDELGINGEIIAIDDGSTDKTACLVQGIIENDKRVKIISHKHPCGIGLSFWEGADNSLGEAVVMLPGDNENDPWEILRYCKLLEHVDIVIPFIYNREVRPLWRNILSLVYRTIVNTTFLINLNYTNGTVIYRKAVLKKLSSRNKSFFFQSDILIRLIKKNYLFAEVPYRLSIREHGVSKALSFPSFLQVANGYLNLVKDFYFPKDNKNLELIPRDSLTFIRRRGKNAKFNT